MIRYILFVVFALNIAYTAGFRVNEQSINSIALNSAYLAGAYGADSSLYNPANMGFGENVSDTELSATWINVPSFTFNTIGKDEGVDLSCKVGQGSFPDKILAGIVCAGVSIFAPNVPPGPSRVSGFAKASNFVVPKFFYKSKNYYGLNFGLSLSAPSGLTMDWGGEGGKFLDDLFIAMLELNPVVSYKINDKLAFGVGGRVVYGMGNFNNSLYVPFSADVKFLSATITTKGTTSVDQISSAQDFGYGYNLAFTYKPFDSTTFSITYRSSVHLNLEGKLSANSIVGDKKNPMIKAKMDADLILSTHIPPVLAIGVARDIGKFKFEFVYERNFWSYGDKFEFKYKNQKFSNIGGTMANNVFIKIDEAYMQNMMNSADYDSVAIGRGWKDTNAFRFGVTFSPSEKLRAMTSFAFDQTPAPQDRFGIPDADGYMVGFGFRYLMFSNLDLGFAYSMTFKDNTQSLVESDNGWGKFQLANIGMNYKF